MLSSEILLKNVNGSVRRWPLFSWLLNCFFQKSGSNFMLLLTPANTFSISHHPLLAVLFCDSSCKSRSPVFVLENHRNDLVTDFRTEMTWVWNFSLSKVCSGGWKRCCCCCYFNLCIVCLISLKYTTNLSFFMQLKYVCFYFLFTWLIGLKR